MQRLILWLYGKLMVAITPLFKRKLLRRARLEREYAQHIPERFGHYDTEKSHGWVWIHAVSLGETRAAAILVNELRQRQPSLRFLLTHGTATGRREGVKLLSSQDIQAWQPWDTPSATTSFLQHFRPRIGIIMETEVWPQLCAGARAQGIPLVLANARLSERSLKRMQWLPILMRPAFESFTEIWAQTEADAARLRQAGAIYIHVAGNLKFDVHLEAALLARGHAFRQASDKPVIIFASSREGEEELFLQALQEYQAAAKANTQPSGTQVQWLIVPRHPQRFDDVVKLCQTKGFSVSRRSEWGNTPGQAEIWLGDSIGEMPMYYAMASVALLGGSFEKLGGQNLIESIACGCPVVMGPHTFNFAQASQQAEAVGAAHRVTTMKLALDMTMALVTTPQQLQTMRDVAKVWMQESSGATKKMSERLLSLLGATQHSTKI